MDNSVYLYSGSDPLKNIFISRKSTLERLPYFKHLMDTFPDYGTREKPLFIDIDDECLYHVIEYLRCGDIYDFPDKYTKIWECLTEACEDDIYDEDEIVTFNVGGELFKSLKRTLTKSLYFESFLTRWNMKNVEFIDKSPVAFRHILSFLRNPDYPIPKEYIHELDFYLINQDEEEVCVNVENKYFNSDNYVPSINTTPLMQLVTNTGIISGIVGEPTNSLFRSGNPIGFTKFEDRFNEIYSSSSCRFGQIINFNIPQTCDLCNKTYILFEISNIEKYQWLNLKHLVYRLAKSISLNIGGNMIDRINGEFIYVYQQLFNRNDYDIFINYLGKNYLILPLYMFFMNEKTSLSFLNLAYHNVNINMEISDFKDLIMPGTYASLPYIDMKLISNFVWLGDEERKDRLQEPIYQHLIKQHQYKEFRFVQSGGPVRFNLDLSSEITELLFVIEDDNNLPMNYFYNDTEHPLISGRLIADGYVVFDTNPLVNGLYLSKIGLPPPEQPIYIIPFSLRPSDPNPTGSFNFSTIDNMQLEINVKPQKGKLKIWGLNHNQLRCMSGMGHLLVSN